MSPALTNFLFEAVNFALLAALLGWVLFKPVRRALDAERERHAEEREEVERLRAEAESNAAEAKEARQALERGADEKRRELLEAAQREADAILEEAKKARDAQRRAAEHERESAQAAQAEAIADVVGRLAAESVRRLLGSLEGPSLDAALVRGARDSIAELPAGARASARVEVARPLDAEVERQLQDALGSPFEARVVAELGAGVRVTTPAGQVDASALSVARSAARAVARAARSSGEATGASERDGGAEAQPEGDAERSPAREARDG